MAGYIDFRNNGAQQGFQNALGMGLQFGAQAAEAANRRGFNNALASYDPSNPDSFKEVAKYDTRAAMALRRDAEAQAAEQRQQQAAQRAKFRGLLEAAGDNPQQAFMAAQAEGIDLSRVPPPDSPEFEQWRQTQLFIFDTLERPDGEKILTEKMKETLGGLPPEHRDIEDPVFIQAWNARMAAERQKTIAWQPGGGAVGYDPLTGEKTVIAGPGAGVEYNPDEWDVVGDAGGNASGGF